MVYWVMFRQREDAPFYKVGLLANAFLTGYELCNEDCVLVCRVSGL